MFFNTHINWFFFVNMANASQEYFNSNKQTMMARGSAASWNQESLTRKNKRTLMNVYRNQSTRKSKHLLKCTQKPALVRSLWLPLPGFFKP